MNKLDRFTNRVIASLVAGTSAVALISCIVAGVAVAQFQPPGTGPTVDVVKPAARSPYTQDPGSGEITFQFPVYAPNTTAQPIAYMPPQAPSGRLTFATATPFMSTPVSAVGTVFYSQYNGATVPLYDGTNWYEYQFAELSNVLANAATGNAGPAAAVASSCYDLFIWNAGTRTVPILTLTRGPAWTLCSNVGGTAARSAGTAVVGLNGIPVNSVSITNGPAAQRGLYVGTIATDAGGATVSFNLGGLATPGVQNVWNYFNRITGLFRVADNGANYTYTLNTVRQARASTNNQVTVLQGDTQDAFDAHVLTAEITIAAAGAVGKTGIGYNSTTAFTCLYRQTYSQVATQVASGAGMARCSQPPKLGQSVIASLQQSDNVNANTFDALTNDELNVIVRY
jgi:hypothetical protein